MTIQKSKMNQHDICCNISPLVLYNAGRAQYAVWTFTASTLNEVLPISQTCQSAMHFQSFGTATISIISVFHVQSACTTYCKPKPTAARSLHQSWGWRWELPKRWRSIASGHDLLTEMTVTEYNWVFVKLTLLLKWQQNLSCYWNDILQIGFYVTKKFSLMS